MKDIARDDAGNVVATIYDPNGTTSGASATMSDAIEISGKTGVICISGTNETVVITDLNGRTVYTGKDRIIPLISGLYIVRLGDTIHKAAVL